MKKGSITVFLSLVLVLIFSFVLTTLEAARIRGATAYASMLSELAGDSFLASYYYPLFQQYRLFGVDAGDADGLFSEDEVEAGLQENMVYGTEGLTGGLLEFQEAEVRLEEYETMLSEGETELLSQVRQQAVLDGLSLALGELFSEELFEEVGVVGEVYRKQEETLAETATVTEELLKLMELADGVSMEKQGIAFDENGKMQAEETFVKQLVVMEQSEIKELYDNARVFGTISGGFFRADRAAGRIQSLIAEVNDLDGDIAAADNSSSGLQVKLSSLKEMWQAEKEMLEIKEKTDTSQLLQITKEIEEIELAIQDINTERDGYADQRTTVLSAIKEEYQFLDRKLKAVESLVEDALETVDTLEKKQKAAQVSVKAYEEYLEGMKNSLSEELYQVFLQELDTMKVYAGLKDKGYSVETMRQSLETDRELLLELSLSGFSEGKLSQAYEEMTEIIGRMKEYTVEGLWFPYGDIRVVEKTNDIVTGALGELLASGVLSLVGVSGDELSDRSLSGKELPSAELNKETMAEDLIACIEDVQQLLQSGKVGEVLKNVGNAALDGTALELYIMKYFHFFGEESPYTRLKYEKEYIVYGAMEDKTNLLYVVLSLVAIRTLFSMVMILKQPERMASLEALSAGAAGFTGIPILASVVKYSLLLLWAVEEALVEVAALLQGKHVAVIGIGTVAFSEIFLCNSSLIVQKAQMIPDGTGAVYRDYLILLSLMQGTKEKAYRVMDLIQENIRYRYRDSFRLRNVVTAISFSTTMELKEQFDTGFFSAEEHCLEWKTEAAY